MTLLKLGGSQPGDQAKIWGGHGPLWPPLTIATEYKISNTNGHRKGKKQQNDQRCNMLAGVKIKDQGISRHGRNTRKLGEVNSFVLNKKDSWCCNIKVYV